MKIVGLVVVVVAVGCASPEKGGIERRDMGGGVGGGPTHVDMSGGALPGSAGSGGGGGGQDMNVHLAADMSRLPDMIHLPDVAMCTVHPPAPTAPCSEFPQCGCAAGQNCNSADATGMTACVASGNTPAYNNCSGVGQCQKGFECVGGVCKPYCSGSGDCPGTNRECASVVDTNSNPIPGDKICSQNCNPLNPQDSSNGFAPCGADVDCGGGTQADPRSDCFGPAVATNTAGTNCNTTNCAPGFVCVGGAVSGYSCYHYCRVGNNGDCPSGTCHALSTGEYVGATQYGYCN